jgi:OmpA-OmpF porin, OOP family
MRRLSVSFLLCGLSAVAEAQEGGYVGVALGSFDYSESDDDFGLTISDSAGAYRLFGGYQFNENYAIEAGLGATEDLKETFRAFDPFFGDVSLTIKADYEISMVRFLAFAQLESMSIFGGAGYYDATVNVSVRFEDNTGVFTSTEEIGDDGAMVVGGIQFERDRIALRGEYEWLDAEGDVDATTLSFGVLFRF